MSAHDDVEQSPKLTHTHDPSHSLDDNFSIMHPSTTPDSGSRRSNQRAAENVERALMKAICPLLPDFVVSCDITQMMQVDSTISLLWNTQMIQ